MTLDTDQAVSGVEVRNVTAGNVLEVIASLQAKMCLPYTHRAAASSLFVPVQVRASGYSTYQPLLAPQHSCSPHGMVFPVLPFRFCRHLPYLGFELLPLH